MTIDEIIKRQKEHLTKAQINELIQATERYKQLNAANRAQATGTLTNQYRATRRGLQNTGLAGRKGKLISGQEKAARIRANEAYREYNAGLRRVDNAYAQNRAARMANETARANQLAEIEKIQAENEQSIDQANQEYREWLRKKKKAAEETYKRQQEEARRQAEAQQNRNDRIYDELHPNAPFTRSDRMQQYEEQTVQPQGYTRDEVIAQRREDLKIRQNDAMHDKLNPNAPSRQAVQYEDVRAEQNRQENAHQMKVSGASNDEIWFADTYGVSADRYNTVKRENPELIKNLTGAIQNLRSNDYDAVINSEGNIYDKHKARVDKAKDESAITKAAVAMGIEDAEMRNLYLMDDTQFEIAAAAAAALVAARQKYDSSDAIQDQMMTSGKSRAFNDTTREAEVRLAKFDQVRSLRTDTSDKSLYYDSYPTDVKTKDAKTVRGFCAINQNTTPYEWADPKNENGENWYQAAQNGWQAENDGNTKYGALVNDWSFVGGRQGMRYQQTGKVAALLANVAPHFYDLADTGTYSTDFYDTGVQSWAVHNGISTAVYYDYVRNSCVKAFYGNNASHEDYEQMDAMLALANLMTDEERARFNALANGSYGAFANEADEYFEYLYKNVLPERFKAYVDETNGIFTDTTYGKIGQSALSVLTNIGEGVTGPIHTMTTNYTDPVSARLGAMKYTTAQAARESVSKDFSPVGKFFYDTGMSMADSATVALISGGIGKALQGAGVGVKLATKAGSVLGGSILGGSAFNSAYKEALDRGLSPDKARTVAVGQGFNEMLFESLSLDLLVGQFQKGGILKVSKNGFVNWFVNTMVQGGVEGSEEVFTDIANRLWDNKVNGIYSEELTKLREYIASGMPYEEAKRKVESEFAEQLGMSFLGGALSGGVMGGGASFLGMVQNRGSEKLGKGLRSNNRVVNELRNFDFKSEYAQEILTQDKLTNQDVADLFNIMQQELLGQYKSDIQQAVEDSKITQEQADLLKQYEENGVQIVHDGEVVENEDGITVEQMPTVQDAIASLDNAARIQFLNNEEMRSLVQAVGGESAAIIDQSETVERKAEKVYRQTVREINNDTTLSPEQKQKRLEAAERTRQNARSEASKIADTALTNKKGIGAKLETDGNGTVKVGKGSGKVTYDFSTKGNPGHQTVDSMTATEQSALRIAKVVAASRGDVNVKVEAEFGVDENGVDHSKENGYYDRSTNTIHINMSGDNSVLWTLSHELTHHLANTDTKAYAALRTAIETALKDSRLTTTELEERGFEYDLDRVDTYIAREGNLWNALVAFEREEHGYGKDAEEEVVARCCESFLGFNRFVKDFARKQYKSARAINKFIAQMNIDMQRVSEDARQSAAQRNVWNDESPENQILRQLTEIDRIANLWRIAVNAEAKKRQAAREETRASTKDSVKRSDAEYLDLARRYESGDKSVESELRKAVDDAAKRAGYAITAFHGTSAKFTVFDQEHPRKAYPIGKSFGDGYYFAADKAHAGNYVEGKDGTLLDTYLKIGKPYVVVTGTELSRADFDEMKDRLGYGEDIDKKNVQIVLQKYGYDGIIAKNYKGNPYTYVVYSPSQIKSADLITYDSDGNIIPLSERFKTDRTNEDAWKNEDIRYSLKDDVKLTDITEYEHFNEEKYANMSETERIEYREHIAEMQIRKEARERQRAIDRNRRIRRDLTAMLKRGNDRIVKMLANPTENSHVPVQLAQAVSEYAMRLNDLLTKSEPRTGENAGKEKQTQKGQLNFNKLIRVYNQTFADQATIEQAARENPGFDPRGKYLDVTQKDESLVQMLNDMNEIVQDKRLSDLDSYELQMLLSTMRGVIHTVQEANKQIVRGEHVETYKRGDRMTEQIESAPKVWGRAYLNETLDLRRLALIYSGSDENAEFVQLVKELNEGAKERARVDKVLTGMFTDLTTKYVKELRGWYGKDAEWIDTGIVRNGKKIEITKGMRVSLAMHVQNSGNMRHITNGGVTIPNRELYRKGKLKDAYAHGNTVALSESEVNEIISHMTEAERAYVEVANEFFHKRAGYYINRTSLRLLGYAKAIVENYFPIHSDANYLQTNWGDIMRSGSVEGWGSLKERREASNAIYLEDITSVVNRQIRGVALYAGLAIPVRNWRAVLNSTVWAENEDGVWAPRTTVQKALTQRMGSHGMDVLEGFLTDVQEASAVQSTGFDKWLAKVQTNYVKSVLLGNAKVALKQLASIPTANYIIPWKYLLKGMFSGKADTDIMSDYTSLWKLRESNNATEITSIMREQGLEAKMPWLLGWITGMDKWATKRLWKACELMVADEGKYPIGSDAYYKAVGNLWDDVIQQTQPNFTPLQRADMLRGTSLGKGKEIAHSLTLFGTQRMQNGGILIESLFEMKNSKGKSVEAQKKARVKFAKAVTSQIVQNVMLVAIGFIVDALRGRMKSWQDDKDKEVTLKSVMKYAGDQFIGNALGSFLGGSEVKDALTVFVKRMILDEDAYDVELTVPTIETLETMFAFFTSDLPKYIKYMTNDKYTAEEKMRKSHAFTVVLARAAGYITGLPFENAVKDMFKGINPALQDLVDWAKTGELNPWLHQSGKLDSANTAANYKEWTNLGKKGSVYLAWENRFKEDTSNGLAHRAELLFGDRELSADEKAILLRMANTTKDNPLTSKDGVVYKDDGTVVVDFTTLDRYRASTMLSDKQYEGFLNLVDMGVAEDVASTAFIQYNVQKKQGSGANDRFRDWLFKTIKNPEDRAKVDMAVVGNTVRVEGTIGYKENGEVYADYSSKEMFELYTNGKKQEKSDAIISTTDTPEAKAKAFAATDNDYHAKGGIVYNDKDKVVADFTSDEAYRASQMGETHYAKYNDAVAHGMSKENAILAVEKHKEITNDEDKDNATQYTTWVFNTYKSANDRAIAGAIYSSKPVTIKDGRTYDENGYIYRDYTSAAWYKLSNRTISSDGTNKRYEAAKKLVDTGLTAERIVEIYEGTTGLSTKSEWKEYLKSLKLTNEQIDIFMKSRWK